MKIYTWKIYNRSDKVKASNMIDAMCEAIKAYYEGLEEPDGFERIDLIIKEGNHTVV